MLSVGRLLHQAVAPNDSSTVQSARRLRLLGPKTFSQFPISDIHRSHWFVVSIVFSGPRTLVVSTFAFDLNFFFLRFLVDLKGMAAYI